MSLSSSLADLRKAQEYNNLRMADPLNLPIQPPSAWAKSVGSFLSPGSVLRLTSNNPPVTRLDLALFEQRIYDQFLRYQQQPWSWQPQYEGFADQAFDQNTVDGILSLLSTNPMVQGGAQITLIMDGGTSASPTIDTSYGGQSQVFQLTCFADGIFNLAGKGFSIFYGANVYHYYFKVDGSDGGGSPTGTAINLYTSGSPGDWLGSVASVVTSEIYQLTCLSISDQYPAWIVYLSDGLPDNSGEFNFSNDPDELSSGISFQYTPGTPSIPCNNAIKLITAYNVMSVIQTN